MNDQHTNKFKVGQLVSYHPFIGKTAVSSGHEILAIEVMPNNYGEHVAWISGKSGCISFKCLSADYPTDYVLRDTRSNCGTNIMFWAAKGSYTTDILQAERFTKEEALSQNQCRNTDEPLLFDRLLEVANSRVDMQHLNTKTAKRYSVVNMVIQVAGDYDGNDILFASDLVGGTTYNFQDAVVISGEGSMTQLTELPYHYRLWPMPYLRDIARKTVSASVVTKAGF